MDDADGPLGQIAVTGQRCFALTRQGMLAECRELAVRHAEDAEPRLSSATREELAAWGGLLLWGAGASVRDNRPDDADGLIRLAKGAAAVAGGDFVPPHAPWHQFGPSVVAVAEAEGAVIRGRPDRALAIGQRLSSQARKFPRHRLDMAGVEWIDSTGMGTLVGALKRARARDGTVQVAGAPDRIAKHFQVTGLARLFGMHGDKWIIEHTGASTAWVAVRRDDLRIVGAHDIGGLSHHIERAEKEDAGDGADQT